MFWKRYTRGHGPESMETTVRVDVHVDTWAAAHAALDKLGMDDPTREWSPDEVEQVVTSWSEDTLRQAVVNWVREYGTGEGAYLSPTESMGLQPHHVEAAQRGVIRAGLSEHKRVAVFGNTTPATSRV